MRVFPRCCCNSSPVPCVAVRCWPAPPLRHHHSQEEAPLVLDRQEPPSHLRASPPVKRAKRKTKKKTKRVRLHHVSYLHCGCLFRWCTTWFGEDSSWDYIDSSRQVCWRHLKDLKDVVQHWLKKTLINNNLLLLLVLYDINVFGVLF